MLEAQHARLFAELVADPRDRGHVLERAGRLLEANAERHLKAEAEIARLFRGEPEAVAETRRFAGLNTQSNL